MMLFKDLIKLRKIYKITLKSQLRHLTSFFITFAGCAVLYLFNLHDAIPDVFMFLIAYVIIIVSTVFIIHCQYLYFNAGAKIELINNDSFIYYRNGIEKIIKRDDIDSIKKYVSYANASGGRYVLPTDFYHYQKIHLKSGDYVFIASLLYQDFNLFSEKTRSMKKIIAIIT